MSQCAPDVRRFVVGQDDWSDLIEHGIVAKGKVVRERAKASELRISDCGLRIARIYKTADSIGHLWHQAGS